MRIAYLGPRGTFTEQATHELAPDTESDDVELVHADTVPTALAAVRHDEADAAAVPAENSVEGSISATMDSLASGEPLVAVAETVLAIRFNVLARPGTTLAEIGTIGTHPAAATQVRGWLAEHLPAAKTHVTDSTAAAARAVRDGELDAAVAAPLAGRHYELTPLATGIADSGEAATRFLLVRRPGELPEPTGGDRTSVAVVLPHTVGSLGEALSEIALRGVNLTRIESRPISDRFGEYRFFLDFEGHVADASVGEALSALHRRCSEVRFLGSFPKADAPGQPNTAGSRHAPRESASERAFRESADWLARVRSGTLA